MTELYRHIGPNTDVPAGDLGVGGREIGYLFGQYKRIVDKYEGVLTGKGIPFGGLLGRSEATGFGIVWYAEEMLKANGEDMKGKVVGISGFGNVAWGAAWKLQQLGAKCVTISGPDGYIYDPEGISTDEKVAFLLELRGSGKNIRAPTQKKKKVPRSCSLPARSLGAYVRLRRYGSTCSSLCAMQNDVHMADVENIV